MRRPRGLSISLRKKIEVINRNSASKSTQSPLLNPDPLRSTIAARARRASKWLCQSIVSGFRVRIANARLSSRSVSFDARIFILRAPIADGFFPRQNLQKSRVLPSDSSRRISAHKSRPLSFITAPLHCPDNAHTWDSSCASSRYPVPADANAPPSSKYT